jgi:hypothetical protein
VNDDDEILDAEIVVEEPGPTALETFVSPAPSLGPDKEWWRTSDGRLVMRTRNFLMVD